jgi:hypothetical protein
MNDVSRRLRDGGSALMLEAADEIDRLSDLRTGAALLEVERLLGEVRFLRQTLVEVAGIIDQGWSSTAAAVARKIGTGPIPT